jgi:copper transport protein
MTRNPIRASNFRSEVTSLRLATYLRRLGFVFGLMFAIAPRAAFAHAHLVKSTPAAGAHLTTAPTLIQLWYSETADPSLTTVTITGPAGSNVTVGALTADGANPLLITATIGGTLPAGTYTVNWRAVAKDDGHPSSGKFSFVIDAAAAATVVANPIADSAMPSHDSASSTAAATAHDSSSTSVMGTDVESPGFIFARWLTLISLVTIIGAIVFRMVVLPRTIRTDAGTITPAFTSHAARGAASLGLYATVFFLIGSLDRLYAESMVMGSGISAGMLLQSFWGHVWLAQFVIGVAVLVGFVAARSSSRNNSDSRAGGAWMAVTIAGLVLAATPAFSGHAFAATSNRTLSVLLDILHVIAAGGWLGGLLVIAAVGIPAAIATTSNSESSGAVPLIARLVNAFSPVAMTLAIVVVLSGFVAAWLHIGSIGMLFNSGYGMTLVRKLIFVILVIAGGAFNYLRMRGALSHNEATHSAVSTFRKSAWFELAAGVLVLVFTAVLIAAQPPIH